MTKIITNLLFILKNLKSFITADKENKAGKILIDKDLKLMTAESCTGGLISSRLTDVSGSSSYIYQNFVTYANDSKENFLGVKHKTITENGVVSYEVSLEMAKGLLKRYNCDIAVSTTGIAGPTGGTKEKPNGLIYITIANKNHHKTYRYEENPLLTRRLMKYAFSSKALELLLNFLHEYYK